MPEVPVKEVAEKPGTGGRPVRQRFSVVLEERSGSSGGATRVSLEEFEQLPLDELRVRLLGAGRRGSLVRKELAQQLHVLASKLEEVTSSFLTGLPAQPGGAVGRSARRSEGGRPLGRSTGANSMRVERMLAEGALLRSTDFCGQMHWTRQALSKAVKDRRVFYVEAMGERVFPAFFADPELERKKVTRVSQALGDLPGGAKLLFMVTPKASLGGATPLSALKDGKLAQVEAAAQAYAER